MSVVHLHGLVTDLHALSSSLLLGVDSQDFLLPLLLELGQGHVELLAAVQNRVWRSDLAVGLNFDFNLLLQRVRLLVASKANSVVLQELVSEHVAEGVVLPVDHCHASESLLLVVFVRHSDQRLVRMDLLGDGRCLFGKSSLSRSTVHLN